MTIKYVLHNKCNVKNKPVYDIILQIWFSALIVMMALVFCQQRKLKS